MIVRAAPCKHRHERRSRHGLLVGAWDVGHGGQPIGGGPAVGERGDDLGHG